MHAFILIAFPFKFPCVILVQSDVSIYARIYLPICICLDAPLGLVFGTGEVGECVDAQQVVKHVFEHLAFEYPTLRIMHWQ